MRFDDKNYKNLNIREKTDAILQRSARREYFYTLLIKLVSIAMQRGLRLIIENPWALQHYLKNNFVLPPTMVDENRTRRGDFFVKPTAFWFVGCVPTYGLSEQKVKSHKNIMQCKKGAQAGICSEERSMISPDYARNFICDFILGKEQHITQPKLF